MIPTLWFVSAVFLVMLVVGAVGGAVKRTPPLQILDQSIYLLQGLLLCLMVAVPRLARPILAVICLLAVRFVWTTLRRLRDRRDRPPAEKP
jgi:hypothetical protein